MNLPARVAAAAVDVQRCADTLREALATLHYQMGLLNLPEGCASRVALSAMEDRLWKPDDTFNAGKLLTALVKELENKE